VPPNIFKAIIAVFLLTYTLVYQFTCTEHKAPDDSDFKGPLLELRVFSK